MVIAFNYFRKKVAWKWMTFFDKEMHKKVKNLGV